MGVKWAIASTPAGTKITNTAVGSFENPNNPGNPIRVISNEVSITVAEVAGITVTGSGYEEAPGELITGNVSLTQTNGLINPDDVIYFTFTITNVGNDPTQFFIPSEPNILQSATLEGNIEIIEVDPDGPNGSVSPTDLKSTPIAIPPGGLNTGDASALGLPDGSIPPQGTVTIRVPVRVFNNATDGLELKVVMGNTPPNDNSAATQNQVYEDSGNNTDIYTHDNQDGDSVDLSSTPTVEQETFGNPANGDAVYHRQEASASQSTLVVVLPTVSTDIPSCLQKYSSLDWATDAPDPANPLNNNITSTYDRIGVTTDITLTPPQSILDLNSILVTDGLGLLDSLFVTANNPNVDLFGGNPIGQISNARLEVAFSEPVSQLSWYIAELGVEDTVRVYGERNGIRVTAAVAEAPQSQGLVLVATPSPLDGSTLIKGIEDPNLTTPLDPNSLLEANLDIFIGFNAPVDTIVIEHLNPTNNGTNLNVLDGAITIADLQMCADFGDAPTSTQSGFASSYPTAADNNGATHIANSNINLGAAIDLDINGQPTADADGDDLDTDGNDEDGIRINGNLLQSQTLTVGSTVNLNVQAQGNGFLNAWIDWNADGDFNDTNEQIATDLAITETNVDFTVNVPTDATISNTYARFRYSTQSGLTPGGLAKDGEVEDYLLGVVANNPNIVLVKRITAINRGKPDQRLFDQVYVDDADTGDIAPEWPTPLDPTSNISTLLAGKVLEEDIKPGDEIEYTIYFLNNGGSDALDVSICDVLQQPNLGVEGLLVDAFGTGQGIQLQWGDGTAPDSTINFTSAIGDDAGEYYLPNTDAPSVCNSPMFGGDFIQPLAANQNPAGAIIVNFERISHLNSTDADATSPWGFIRLRTQIE